MSAPKTRGWRRVTTPPKEFETVLTIHEDDLYPMPAFRLVDADGSAHWLRESEGPEDIYDFERMPEKHGELYRAPTHWMPLPDSPRVESERDAAIERAEQAEARLAEYEARFGPEMAHADRKYGVPQSQETEPRDCCMGDCSGVHQRPVVRCGDEPPKTCDCGCNEPTGGRK